MRRTFRGCRRREPELTLRVSLAAAFVVAALVAPQGLRADCRIPEPEVTAFLDLLASGRYDAAQAKVSGWPAALTCACETGDCFALEQKGTVVPASPAGLASVVTEAAAWERTGRSRCDVLLGGDAIGAGARRACLERHGERPEALVSELARKLVADRLPEMVRRLERTPPEDIDGAPAVSAPAEIPASERTTQKINELAREICEMRLRIDELDERLERVKRQPAFMGGEYRDRLQQHRQLLQDLREAHDRARDTFRKYAGREFDALQDCRAGDQR